MKNKTLLIYYFVFIFFEATGCGIEIPSPPPNLFYKFNVLEVGQGPANLITIDLNLDGISDIASANAKNNTLSVLLGNGDGTFRKTLTFPVYSEPTTIVSGDINRDGIPDLLTNARGERQFVLLLGYGNGSFMKPIGIQTGRVPLAIIPADYNNDGNLDVAITLTFDKMEIFIGSGSGTFEKGESYITGSRSFSGVVDDFDGDGNVDIALATHSSVSSAIRLFKGKGNGTFYKPRQLAQGLTPLTIVKEDMNNDGFNDIIFASGQGDNLYMLISRGDGTFEKEIAFSAGGGPISLTTGNFNSDKQIDVAVANSRSSNFSLVMRKANGYFHYPTRDYIVDGGTPLAITSGHYNQDGLIDIAVASNAKNTIEIFLQRRVFQ